MPFLLVLLLGDNKTRHIIFISALCLVVGCTARQHEAEKEADVDILEYLSKHPHKVSVIHYPDGSTYRPKYGDIKLEEAEELLGGSYERPWTVPKVIAWYFDSEQPKIRAALLSLLAASQDKRAVPLLGAALDDSLLEVRIAATYGILDYFLGRAVNGGTEGHMAAAHEWWEQWKSKQEK